MKNLEYFKIHITTVIDFKSSILTIGIYLFQPP